MRLISNEFGETTILLDGHTSSLLQVGTDILRFLPVGKCERTNEEERDKDSFHHE
jgi:hypothetical protein